MKKFLLPIVAVCACVAPAFADEVYGTTPETAKPFPIGGWHVEDLSAVPSEVYFTYTSTSATPINWGNAPVASEKQIYVYFGNGGPEAYQWIEGTDSYSLFPNQEYLIKITPKATGFFCDAAAMAFPASFEGNKYYPKAVSTGAGLTVQPGSTLWVELDMPYAAQLVMSQMLPIGNMADITSVEVNHIEAPGGTNKGSGLFVPVAKKGKNVIGFTVKEGASSEVYFMLTLSSATYTCEKNLLRGVDMTLGVQETYMDAYYTVDRFFTVPADGTYVFTNHGAPGTKLTVGAINLTDPANEFAYECDWDNAQSAVVASSDAKVTMNNLKKGDKVFVRSDAYTTLNGGIDNPPYLLIETGKQTGIADVAAEADALKVSVNGGVLTVESALLASGAEVAVYDMLGRKVASTTAAAGAANVELNLDAAAGVYVVAVNGKGGSESAKIAVK